MSSNKREEAVECHDRQCTESAWRMEEVDKSIRIRIIIGRRSHEKFFEILSMFLRTLKPVP